VIISDSNILSAQFLSSTTRLESLKSEHSALTTKHAQLQTGGLTSTSEMDVNKLNSRFVSLYGDKERLEAQNQLRREEIASLERQKATLESQLNTLGSDNLRLEQSVAALQERRVSLESQLDRLDNELAAIEKEIQTYLLDHEKRSIAVTEYEQKVRESAAFIKEAESKTVHRPLIRHLTSLEIPVGAITGLMFGSHYQSIMAVGENRKFYQFGLPGLNELACYPTVGVANSFRVNNETQMLALSGNDKTVRILQLETGRIISELRNHTDSCTDCQWISRNQLISSSKDRTIKLFDINRNAVTATYMAMSAVFSLCETASPQVYVAGCFDGHLRLLDLREKSGMKKIEKVHPSKQISCVVTTGDKDLIYSIGTDNTISLTSLKGSARIKQFTHSELIVKNLLTRIAIDPAGGFLAAGSQNGTVLLFDLIQPGEPKILKHHSVAVCNVAFAANMLVTGDTNGSLSFWVA
jgi:predicted  nucleic acid-binding Zn-ribbon protein